MPEIRLQYGYPIVVDGKLATSCCLSCCSCTVCADGQEGKCCCGGDSGNCCQPGEYCCGGQCKDCPCNYGACRTGATCADCVSQAACQALGGTWFGPGTKCNRGACTLPPSGYFPNGACFPLATQYECAFWGGTYQGEGTNCDEYNAPGPCCVPSDMAGYSICEEGYHRWECPSWDGVNDPWCDPVTSLPPPPAGGNPACQDGSPTTVTVTASGIQPLVPAEQYLADLLNQAFVVDLDGVSGSVTQDYTDANGTPWRYGASASFNASSGTPGLTVSVSLFRLDVLDTACGGVPRYATILRFFVSLPVGYTCNGVPLADCTGYAQSGSPTVVATYGCVFGPQPFDQVVNAGSATITIA